MTRFIYYKDITLPDCEEAKPIDGIIARVEGRIARVYAQGGNKDKENALKLLETALNRNCSCATEV